MSETTHDVILGVLLLAVGIAWLSCLASCGGLSAQARTRYSIRVAACITEERAIIARERGGDPSDDADIDEALRLSRAHCDAALAEIAP